MKKITLLLLMILPLIGLGQNLAPNPTLNGTTDWSDLQPGTSQAYDAGFTRTADGSGSWLINSDGTYNSGIKSSNISGLVAGDYILSYYVYGNAGDKTTPIMRDNGIGSNIQGDVYTILADNTWELAQSTFTVSGTGTVNLRAMVNSNDTAMDFYVDDFSFTYIPPGGNTLTINVVGAGAVTANPDQISYQPTDVVSLTAVPATHWNFNNWTGDLTGTTNPESLLMDTDKTVTATFTVDPTFDYAFTFDTDGDLEGWAPDASLSIGSHTGGLVTFAVAADSWSRFNLDGFPIPVGSFNKVTITLKNETTNDELGFVVEGETRTQTMSTNDTSFQMYDFALEDYANWVDPVDYVRVRFSESTNSGQPLVSGNIIIDDIVFSYDPTLSNQDVSIEAFNMYPNPTNGVLNIAYQGTIKNVEVFDITGKQVLSTNGFTNNTQLNVSNLNSGIYLVKLVDDSNNSSIKKLVLQ